MNIEELFLLGMKRDIPDLVPPVSVMPVLNLGAGLSTIPGGAINLDLPGWDAEEYRLDYEDLSVGGIFAFHFLEHLTDPRRMVAECARVLAEGCALTICVPWFGTQMAYQDLDHKQFFTLDSWKQWLENDYYDPRYGDVPLRVGANFVMGVVDRNLAVFTQLIKESR